MTNLILKNDIIMFNCVFIVKYVCIIQLNIVNNTILCVILKVFQIFRTFLMYALQ